MKNLITTVFTFSIVGSAFAQTSVSLIDADFEAGTTLSTNVRIRTNQANGNFWTTPTTDWEIIGEQLSNAGTSLTGGQTEGAISQVIETSTLADDLTSLTLSFDYEVGATATLKFALIGYTLNVQDGQDVGNFILMNNGTSNGSLQNNTQAELRYGDINLFTGADMTQSITNDVTFAAGTSGSYSVSIDLTSYAWHADEAVDAMLEGEDGAVINNTPGLSGSITSIADFDYVVLVAVNDLDSEIGVTPTTLDNLSLTATTSSPSSVPNITAIEVDGSGNVVLTLDGPVAGFTVQQSETLAIGSFSDVASTAGTNTLTVDSADVDRNADGTAFYRIRN